MIFVAVMVFVNDTINVFGRIAFSAGFMGTIARPCYSFQNGFLRHGLQAVRPTDSSEEVDERCRGVEHVITQFGRLVVVWKYVMVIVESFAICQYRHSDVLCWRDVSGNRRNLSLHSLNITLYQQMH